MGRSPGPYSRRRTGGRKLNVSGRAVRNVLQRLDRVGKTARQNAFQNSQRVPAVPLVKLVIDQLLKRLRGQGGQTVFPDGGFDVVVDLLLVFLLNRAWMND